MQLAPLAAAIAPPAPLPAARVGWRFYATAALMAALAALALGLAGGLVFPVDDAYIVQHNASLLPSGPDPNYPGTPPLAGSTSLAHLALVAAAASVLPLPAAALAVAIMAVLLYVTGLARLALLLGGGRRAAWQAICLGTLAVSVPFHLLNGLETGLALAAITWALAWAVAPPTPWALPLLCGVLPFIRPELAALALPLMVRQACLAARPARALALLPPCLLGAAPWLAWSYWGGGQWLPATISAKTWYFAEAGLPLAARLAILGDNLAQPLQLVPACGVLALALLLRPPRQHASLAACIVLFALAYLGASLLQLPGALGHNALRYPLILLPPAVLLLLAAARQGRAGRLLLGAAVLAALLGAAFPLRLYLDAKAMARGEFADLAHWSEAHLPPRARLLVHDAGYLAVHTRFQLVDLVGLKTPASARWHHHFTLPEHGRQRALAVSTIAACSGATHAVIQQDRAGRWWQLAAGLRAQGWQLTLLRPAPVVDGYAVFALAHAGPAPDCRLPPD
jgi:hypothetical protein